ncbi:MarR family transcriptional regulator [Nocardia sp. CDC153]|uniref:MarR family winged helix-turn-helix transcriptional regulator n=1 Tax=Nocardia sp. CDC153 TaxID=3112167 RepID=UPI002DB70DBB|nr:MarR family transcriptional regulator [Nocardia sp. CDC153]MEC3952030.1 MarR family transcriptional regulator [Nocardia sp. CDC153]
MSGSTVYREYLTAQIVVGQATAQALKLGATDFFGLNLIALSGSLTAGELAAKTGLSTGAATRLIDRLEQTHYVRRVRDPHDRRKVIIEPDPSRRAELAAALEPLRVQMAEVFARYDPAALDILFDYFTEATRVLRNAAQDLTDGGVSD